MSEQNKEIIKTNGFSRTGMDASGDESSSRGYFYARYRLTYLQNCIIVSRCFGKIAGGNGSMTIYQELQLSSVGSKQLIRATEDKKEKRRHILIYNFKVYLVMAFCVAVVSLYSSLTGKDNSVVGVTVLLAVLVLRQADFGIRTTHGLGSILGIFTILMTGPRISNLFSPVPAFFINVICILLLMILGCHNVIMYNHSTFVLGYLLLQGYDVTGRMYVRRVEGLLVGMILCMIIFYKNQKNRPYRRTFLDLFREFDVHSARNRWYIRLALIASSAMLFMSLAGLPRAKVE